MISNITNGSVDGTLAYVGGKYDKATGEIVSKHIAGNTFSKNHEEIASEFKVIRSPRGLKNPVKHISLSLHPKEAKNASKFPQMAKEYVSRMGYKNNQWVAYQHFDAEHPHIHIVINRVSTSDFKTVKDGNERHKSMSILRDLEQEFGLQYTKSYSDNKSLNNKEYRLKRREGKLIYKDFLRYDIDNLIRKCNSFDQFLKASEFNGTPFVIKTRNNAAGEVTGISYKIDDWGQNDPEIRFFPGHKLGSKYSVNGLKKHYMAIEMEHKKHQENKQKFLDNLKRDKEPPEQENQSKRRNKGLKM